MTTTLCNWAADQLHGGCTGAVVRLQDSHVYALWPYAMGYHPCNNVRGKKGNPQTGLTSVSGMVHDNVWYLALLNRRYDTAVMQIRCDF